MCLQVLRVDRSQISKVKCSVEEAFTKAMVELGARMESVSPRLNLTVEVALMIDPVPIESLTCNEDHLCDTRITIPWNSCVVVMYIAGEIQKWRQERGYVMRDMNK